MNLGTQSVEWEYTELSRCIALDSDKIFKIYNKVLIFFFNFRFPLHDKDRLEKWLKNMKRDSWVPSKYQFLCSDHFTPDSLDIRWGIRYLKQTAIPTIFSLPEDSEVLEWVRVMTEQGGSYGVAGDRAGWELRSGRWPSGERRRDRSKEKH